MALTQVRAKLGDVWTVLTYNEATGRYEGSITPPGTSAHQPGGYYNITVEASNATGQTATLDGTQYTGLRLVVRETAAPTLELVSPPAGWLTTAAPSFVFQAQDEAGGSGIYTNSAKAAIDGASVPCTVTEAAGVYTVTFAASGLSEGPHLVTVSISDLDGNETAVSAAYQVDTVPPVLLVTAPDLHRVVDWESVTVSGYARDATSGVASVTVDGVTVWPPAGGGTILSQASPDSSFQKEPLSAAAGTGDGSFSTVVHLEVGVNQIEVKVTDNAGLTTTQTVWMLRLLTDRTQEDVAVLAALLEKQWDSFSEEEKAYWNAPLKGSYQPEDWNRVGTAVEYISEQLAAAGYAPGTSPKTDWTEDDDPTSSELETYIRNIQKIKAQFPGLKTNVPYTLRWSTIKEWNDIEAILVEVDRLFPLMERSAIYSGEVFSGEW